MPIPAIQNTASLSQNGPIKVLVYGKSGMGKTHLISTLEKPLVLSVESGLLTLRKHNIPFMTVKTRQDLLDTYQWLISDPRTRESFHTICLDSISEMAEMCLAEIKLTTKDGRQQYGILNEQMAQIIRDFRDLPFNVYFSAKQEYDKDEFTGMLINRASMPGKTLAASLPYYFDEVFQIYTATLPNGTSYRALRTAADPANDAKDRSSVLAPVEEPHLGKIFAKIRAA